jgi:hypothetical protein
MRVPGLNSIDALWTRTDVEGSGAGMSEGTCQLD